ncbi:MAG: NUDIX domain-containing protein [Candidatus Shapirobacteria bacterium]|jgi:8-oxo-dGTP pyrophosphatase MutT (NUDIX family)
MNEDVFHLGIKALIRNKVGKILLLQVNLEKLTIKDRGAYWDIPGGRIQRSSTVEETLKREIEEETGILEIANIKQVAMVLSNIRIPLKDGGDLGLILSIYECQIPESSEKLITISDEHVAWEWFEPKEAAKLLSVKYPKEFTEIVACL